MIFETGEETLEILRDLGRGGLSACPLPVAGTVEDSFGRRIERARSNLRRAGRDRDAEDLQEDASAERLFGSRQMI